MSPRASVEAAEREHDPDDAVDVGGVPAALADRARIAAVWTGFGAAVLGFFAAVVVALAMWIPDAAATGTSGSTVRGGLLAFLAAQHGGVRIDGVPIGFLPLGLTWFAVYLCRRSGRVLWGLPVVTGDVGRRRVIELSAVQVVSYAVTTTLVSFYAVVGRSSASPVAVAVGSVVVGVVGFGSVALTMTPVGRQGWLAVSAPVRAAARAAAAAVCMFLAGGAVLALGSTVLRIGRFLDLSRGMGRGLSGLPVAVGDTFAVPNVVVAGTAYLAGPGFAVGHHCTYAPFGGHGGLVPAFPVLAGLPDGEHASLSVLALLALTVVGAGLTAGLILARETAGLRWPVALGTALGCGGGAAVALGVLTALAGGSLGSRRLQTVGASPVQVGLAVLVEVTLVATATVGARRLLAQHAAHDAARTRSPKSDDAVSGPGVRGARNTTVDQTGDRTVGQTVGQSLGGGGGTEPIDAELPPPLSANAVLLEAVAAEAVGADAVAADALSPEPVSADAVPTDALPADAVPNDALPADARSGDFESDRAPATAGVANAPMAEPPVAGASSLTAIADDRVHKRAAS